MGSGPNWHMDQTTAPPFVVNDVGTFSAFEIKVQAVNDKGEGPEPDPVIGYSGEDGKQKIKIFFFYLILFLLCLTYQFLCLSTTGGSNGCGCCAG